MGEDEEWLLAQLDALAREVRGSRTPVPHPKSQPPTPEQPSLPLEPASAPEPEPVLPIQEPVRKERTFLPVVPKQPAPAEGVPSSAQPAKPHYHGHRQRLREKFLAAARVEALSTIADYELLELLLFLAIPQKDVKPLAKQILAHFGSLGAVFTAHPDDLMACPGIKESAAVALKAVQAAALHMVREDVINRPVLSSWDRLLDYCHATMAFQDIEQFRILFLDRKNCLIADELHQSGTVDHTPVYPREVVKRALELRACALILVHNHPSGDPQPSPADIEMTRKIAEALRHVDISLHDHLVVSRTGYSSFKADGLL